MKVICPICEKEFNINTTYGLSVYNNGTCPDCKKEINDWGKYLFENREKIKKLIEKI